MHCPYDKEAEASPLPLFQRCWRALLTSAACKPHDLADAILTLARRPRAGEHTASGPLLGHLGDDGWKDAVVCLLIELRGAEERVRARVLLALSLVITRLREDSGTRGGSINFDLPRFKTIAGRLLSQCARGVPFCSWGDRSLQDVESTKPADVNAGAGAGVGAGAGEGKGLLGHHLRVTAVHFVRIAMTWPLERSSANNGSTRQSGAHHNDGGRYRERWGCIRSRDVFRVVRCFAIEAREVGAGIAADC